MSTVNSRGLLRSSQRDWLPLLTLLIGAGIAIWFLSAAQLKIIEVNEAALGGDTTAVLAESDGLQVSCFDASDTKRCEGDYNKAGHMPAILWFGNSQNFAINRYRPGDELAIVRLHKWLKQRGTWLVQYTQPNANLHEQALLFESLHYRYDTRLFILPIFMDKLREQGIRESVAKFMDDAKAAERVRASPSWNALSSLLIKKVERRSDPTIQERVEEELNEAFGKYWSLWRDRSMLRGNLGFAIHLLRNKMLGIHSYTKRPVDPAVYAEKLGVLETLLESAKTQKIPVLLYIPPYRRDISGPYDDDAYRQFKEDIKALAAKYQAHYADLDDIVPGPLWATVVDTIFGFEEPDFMHFTAEGHRRLAEAIQRCLKNLGF